MPRLPVPSDTARAYPPALIQTAHGFENPRVWCILETRRRTPGFESRLLAPTQQGPLAERAFVAFVVLVPTQASAAGSWYRRRYRLFVFLRLQAARGLLRMTSRSSSDPI